MDAAGNSLAGTAAKGLFSSIGSRFNGGDGLPQTAASAYNAGSGLFDGIGSFFTNLFHSGGIVGTEGGSRWVDPRVFHGATRYHTGGIAGDEVPAVLQAGEGVFTAGQMAALGANANAGQGGDTHFNFNVNATGAGPREIDQLKSAIPLMAMQAVQSGMQRGGQFAKTVRGS